MATTFPIQLWIDMTLEHLNLIKRDYGGDPYEKFYVERHFLNNHTTSDTSEIFISNQGSCTIAHDNPVDGHCVLIRCYTDHIYGKLQGDYSFYYFGGEGGDFGPEHGLMIVDNDGGNILYWRDSGQNPETEWLINEMAMDLTDENGQYVFNGDPYLI